MHAAGAVEAVRTSAERKACETVPSQGSQAEENAFNKQIKIKPTDLFIF